MQFIQHRLGSYARQCRQNKGDVNSRDEIEGYEPGYLLLAASLYDFQTYHQTPWYKPMINNGNEPLMK